MRQFTRKPLSSFPFQKLIGLAALVTGLIIATPVSANINVTKTTDPTALASASEARA